MLSCHQQKCYIFVNFEEYNLFDILLLLLTFLIFNLVVNHFSVIFHIFFGKYTLLTYSDAARKLQVTYYLGKTMERHDRKNHLQKFSVKKIILILHLATFKGKKSSSNTFRTECDLHLFDWHSRLNFIIKLKIK